MIKLGDALAQMNLKGEDLLPVPFSLDFIKLSDGSVQHLESAVICGLDHNMKENRTIGIKNLDNKEVRAIKYQLIKSFNGKQVYY